MASFGQTLKYLSPAFGLYNALPEEYQQGVKKFLVGSPSQGHQIDIFRPEQQNIMSQLAQMGLSGIQNPTQGFQPIANQARQNFAQQTIPMLAERFTGSTGGRLSSPSFISQLGQAGAGLESNLAAQEAQFGQNQLSALLPLLQLGLQPQFNTQMSSGGGGVLPALLAALGTAFAGPGGGAAGYAAGSGISSLFQ